MPSHGHHLLDGRRAYKIKALEFHPDKNIGDKKAEQMFMMVAKAYEALTDEAAKENWQLYGDALLSCCFWLPCLRRPWKQPPVAAPEHLCVAAALHSYCGGSPWLWLVSPGNPDGKQSLEVSIGLPTFLLEKDNHNLILIVYLIGLVVVIPVIVGLWCASLNFLALFDDKP